MHGQSLVCSGRINNISLILVMTEFIFKYLRSITFSLAILMLCQCCRVYYKEPVSVNEAMNNKLKCQLRNIGMINNGICCR